LICLTSKRMIWLGKRNGLYYENGTLLYFSGPRIINVSRLLASFKKE
jgi:hypothetical protein